MHVGRTSRGLGDMVLRAEEVRKWLVANQVEEVHKARLDLVKLLKKMNVEYAKKRVGALVGHLEAWERWMQEREEWEKESSP